jgi:GTPase SAR1 family protein
MKPNVRILVVGDAGVGKSTFITSFVSNYCIDSVPDVHPEHVLPGQFDGCNITIMDSSVHPGDAEILDRKIMFADSVIVLFDANRRRTLVWVLLFCIIKFIEQTSGSTLYKYKLLFFFKKKRDLVLDLPQEDVDNKISEVS